MTALKTSEVLDLAADHILGRGWLQFGGWNDSPTGPVCLEGGIAAALGLTAKDLETPEDVPDSESYYHAFQDCPAYQAVKSYLEIDHALFWWNDVFSRTADEVIEVLRGAAVVERVKEATLEAVPA
jgi:hypothetical protein